MLKHPEFSPVAIHLGPLSIHWYGLMYLLGFAVAWVLGKRRIGLAHINLSDWQWEDLIFYCLLGVVSGGRIGYMLFYNSGALIHEPLEIFKIWHGGMSFHGGLLGVLISMFIFSRRINRPFLQIADFIAPLVPPGLGFGRLGNFINSELVGRATDMPWGMVFRTVDLSPRHPSQIYEMVWEGLVLFLILMVYSRKRRKLGAVSGLFLLCYGIFRFTLEFFRAPDVSMGFIAYDWLTMGQLLSIPLILAGTILLWRGDKWAPI